MKLIKLDTQNIAPEQVARVQKFQENRALVSLFGQDSPDNSIILSYLSVTKDLTLETAKGGISIPLMKKIERNASKKRLPIFFENVINLTLQGMNIETNDFILTLSVRRLHELNGGWTLKDVILMMKKGGAGKFGNNYKSYDLETLERWILEYDKLKLDYWENYQTRKKIQDSKGEMSEENRQRLEKITKNLLR